MDEEIHLAPARLQGGEAGVQAFVIGDIDIDKEIRPDRGGEGGHAFAEGFALIGEGKLCPLGRHGGGDAPCDGAFVCHAHDKPALALHQIGHVPVPFVRWLLSAEVFAHHEGGVGAAEAEAVGQDGVELHAFAQGCHDLGRI